MSAHYSGNIILSTLFSLQTGQSQQIGDRTYQGPVQSDVLIVKYGSSGSVVWSKKAGGEQNEYAANLSCDSQDHIYMVAECLSPTVKIKDAQITLNEGDGNILFAKLDPQGAVL